MPDSSARLFVAFVGLGLLLIWFRWYANRSERGRAAARRMYANLAVPHFMRHGVAIAPQFGVASILIGVAVLVPRLLGMWLVVPAFLLAGAAFVSTYRVPPVFAPHWLREEITTGRVKLARPGLLDWLLFWLVLPFLVLGPVAIVVYILAFESG